MSTRKHRSLIACFVLVVSLVFLGCSLLDTADSVGVEKMREEERMRLDEASKDDEARSKAKAESDQVLAEGDVLSVRVNYGESTASQCQVRIENERNGWYDEVEHIVETGSPLGSLGSGRDDYTFGSSNFNRQLTQPEYYDPDDAKGDYSIIVTANDGYHAVVKVYWDGERLSPSLLAFALD